MRALLIVNPTATRVRTADVTSAVTELAAAVSLEVAITAYAGHAGQLARQAVGERRDLVAVMGGDGTVNEAVNGLLLSEPDRPPESRPALGIIPTGGINVVARAFGLRPHVVRSTRQLASAARQGRRMVVNLGKTNERYFLGSAGMGWGAELMERIHQHRRSGHAATWTRYVAEGGRHFLWGTDRRNPALTVSSGDGEAAQAVFACLVSNTSPYAYLGSWPLCPSPRASFRTDLEALALMDLSAHRCASFMTRMLLRPRCEHVGPVRRFAQQTVLSVTASRPMPYHVDGEPLAPVRKMTFSSSRRALTVMV
ncbi:diacylglycerol/lipid kinase family protein [Streptomyces sp. NPDC048650]|uniref:diacylglycerol/lipid kinase family protein n=1 Tax=unclassified Streptomyces TaxID=2593676 RepID=UPI00372074CB